ncbi:hypothetical protein HanXRQr2_Chr07g0293761 [Helianthus annuus]|uniref:Uncharacterized protein n=1 Tax=Helianthus annuus TaxID=4232 RepID=A0A9K3IL77_HELAN|nr:hypothetical protein HanXRQr2_Chr07g0293761 [Helianthus annuus]KAJ0904623.1 hypothetical protein HanPSC8_Chr07g0284401 [Helianthus annuus]
MGALVTSVSPCTPFDPCLSLFWTEIPSEEVEDFSICAVERQAT